MIQTFFSTRNVIKSFVLRPFSGMLLSCSGCYVKVISLGLKWPWVNPAILLTSVGPGADGVPSGPQFPHLSHRQRGIGCDVNTLLRDCWDGQMRWCFSFLQDFIYLVFRERGREGERERNISVWLLLVHPHWGPDPQPRHVPQLGIKLTTFVS